jgi:serine/threonine protein kinase
MSPRLIATQGPLAGRRFTIPSQGLTIGRHSGNDVVLVNELMVSRYHAVVTVERGQYVLHDRDSANGTWVNEKRVFRHTLVPGDRLQIWRSQFVFGTSEALPPSPSLGGIPQSEAYTAGKQFCGYYLERLIGRGGMSEVFKAQNSHGQPVAIKILKERDPYLVAKFIQEGNQIGPLLRGHANIVYVHEFGQSPDNRLYIVMEYVDATSLRKSLRGPMSESETVQVIGQVCDALAFAHENNVVHRDIKPENILMKTDGEVKVLDFGIAKLTSASTVTRDKIVGTPEYISPEQAQGETVGPASDVYSIGVVLYEMLTGSVPFRRARKQDPYRAAIQIVEQHLHESPEPMRRRNPRVKISRRLERITMRALNKEIKDRYISARELGQALGTRGQDERQTTMVPQAAACLLIVQGPRQGQQIRLSRNSLTLGRLQLDSSNPMISRCHAHISFRAGSYWLEDRSKNGTWVDNSRVYGEVPLAGGSVIVIGDNVLKLEQQPCTAQD